LVEIGIIDSIGILELINYLGKNFNIEINDEEIIPENFATIKILFFSFKKRSKDQS